MKRHISSLYKVAARSPGRTPCFPDITRHSNPFGWCLRLLIWSIYICIWSCPGSSIPYPCGIKWVVVVPQKVTFDIETSWPSPWLTLSLTPWPTPCPTHDRPHIWPHDWPHVWLHSWPHEQLHTEAMNVLMNLRCFEVTTPFPGSRPLPRHCQSEACGDDLHQSVHLMFCTWEWMVWCNCRLGSGRRSWCRLPTRSPSRKPPHTGDQHMCLNSHQDLISNEKKDPEWIPQPASSCRQCWSLRRESPPSPLYRRHPPTFGHKSENQLGSPWQQVARLQPGQPRSLWNSRTGCEPDQHPFKTSASENPIILLTMSAQAV